MFVPVITRKEKYRFSLLRVEEKLLRGIKQKAAQAAVEVHAQDVVIECSSLVHRSLFL